MSEKLSARENGSVQEGLMEEYQTARKARTGSIQMVKNVLNEDSEAVITIEDALALVGGFGRFQWISSIICVSNYSRSALFFSVVPFMEL